MLARFVSEEQTGQWCKEVQARACLGSLSVSDCTSHSYDQGGSQNNGASMCLCTQAQPNTGDPATELKLCKVCLQELPLPFFPLDHRSNKPKGCFCLSCSAASESMQRAPRGVWGPAYRSKYKALKDSKEQWRQIVLSYSKDPSNRKRRALKMSSAELVEVVEKGKRQKLRRERAPLTYFETWFTARENGGLSTAQCQKRWDNYVRDPAVKRDRNGTVSGIDGQLRLWVQTQERELSDDEEARVAQHKRVHTNKKGDIDQTDVDAFVRGPDDDEGLVLASEVSGDSLLVSDKGAATALANNIEAAMGWELSVCHDDDASTAAPSMESSASSTRPPCGPVSEAGKGPQSSAGSPPSAPTASETRWAKDKEIRKAAAFRELAADVEEVKALLVSCKETLKRARQDVRVLVVLHLIL